MLHNYNGWCWRFTDNVYDKIFQYSSEQLAGGRVWHSTGMASEINVWNLGKSQFSCGACVRVNGRILEVVLRDTIEVKWLVNVTTFSI